jgi:DNA-binding response OmpR family regulator
MRNAVRTGGGPHRRAPHSAGRINDPVTLGPNPIAKSPDRVLVVDDEPGVVSFLARALRGRGFEVDVAGSGEDALAIFGARRYDVVLLDLRMPVTSGVVVLKQLMQERPDQKVVVVSAAADTRIKVRCLELGASDFVAKPFELAELVARVAAHARRPRAAQPANERRLLRAGRLELDLDHRTVDAGGPLAALPSREFLLLRHLMRRAGRPCSREELLAEVWGTQFDAGTNVIDTYVHRLRQKLGPETIETVRNVGYRLVG